MSPPASMRSQWMHHTRIKELETFKALANAEIQTQKYQGTVGEQPECRAKTVIIRANDNITAQHRINDERGGKQVRANQQPSVVVVQTRLDLRERLVDVVEIGRGQIGILIEIL
jgi:hypothetical protein